MTNSNYPTLVTSWENPALQKKVLMLEEKRRDDQGTDSTTEAIGLPDGTLSFLVLLTFNQSRLRFYKENVGLKALRLHDSGQLSKR